MPAIDNSTIGFGLCIQVVVFVQPGILLQIADE
jgi:hypothetical protein